MISSTNEKEYFFLCLKGRQLENKERNLNLTYSVTLNPKLGQIRRTQNQFFQHQPYL